MVVLLLAACLCAGVAAAGPVGAVTGSWSDHLADLPGAAQLSGAGRGVTVAVLDTWVDRSHPDFGGRVAAGVSCTADRCSGVADNPDACEPHGTHVAGIVASTHYGVAPQARVFPIRVLTSRSGACAADANDVARGIRYAVAHHIRIINVSLGSTFPLEDPQRVLPAAVSAATTAGDLVVVAAGNGHAAAARTYGPDALTVAALGPDGQLASYSQRGAGVDIAAPGGDALDGNCNPAVCVVSTWQDGGYASDAGTSMAAPFVSGTAALLLSQDPKRSLRDVRKIILSTADPLPGAGAGRLDVLAAVRLHADASAAPQDAAGAHPLTGSSAPHTTPSVMPPAAGGPPAAATRLAPVTTARAAGHRPGRHPIGAVQLLGIVVVGGVSLAFFTVSSRRARRPGG